MSIVYKGKGIILSAASTPYKIDGNEGVSHRVRVSVNGEIYPCKSTEAQVNEIQALVGKEATVEVSILSRKESIYAQLVSAK